jgi:glycosyltransferase involved in cell wall biosynthesis
MIPPVERADLSILIPTYNGEALIGRLLASLASASLPRGLTWEVVVVNNNSRDRTEAVVAGFRGTLPNLRHLFEPQPGKCRALNTGVRNCQGTWVAFLDHDVEVDQGYLLGVERATREFPHVSVFGGRVLPKWSTPIPYWVNRGRPLTHSWGGVVAHDHGDTPGVYDPAMRLPVGANFFCRRSLFDRVGLFNVNLGPRPGAQIAGEESDLLMRFKSAGEEIMYWPFVTVQHPVPAERVSKRYFRYRFFCDGRTGCRLTYGSGRAKAVLGIPIYLFRAWGEAAAGYVGCWLRLDPMGAFDRELEICYLSGSLYEYARIARRGIEDEPGS